MAESNNFYKNQNGQALIEYILIFAFIALIGLGFIKSFGSFFSKSFTNIGHVLTMHLSVGICNKQCFYPQYSNGKK